MIACAYFDKLARNFHFTGAVLWRGAVLATLVLATGHSASAASKGKDESLEIPRPADSYAIHFETDNSVCGPIATSLNKEFRINPNKLDDIPRVNLPSDSFLSTDIQVNWTRKFVEQPDGANFKITSLDVAQVMWRGHSISLFRRTVEKSFPEIGALAINRVWMSDTALPRLTTERTVATDYVDHLIRGKEILVDVDKMQNFSKSRNLALRGKDRNLAKPVLLNVASTKGRLFLLAVDALQAEIAAPRAADGMVDVFVLEIFSDTNIRTVCWLSSTQMR